MSWLAALLLLLLILAHLQSTVDCGSDSWIRCYQQKKGSKFQECRKRDGFHTCFSKYDHNHNVILRGCSSKRKMFHVECENHLSGARNEQFCCCSYDLCNGGSASIGPALIGPLMLVLNLGFGSVRLGINLSLGLAWP